MRVRIGLLAVAVAILAIGSTSAALAGGEKYPTKGKLGKAAAGLLRAIAEEKAAQSDLRHHRGNSADDHIAKSQFALLGVIATLGPNNGASWESWMAGEHDDDALDDCYVCAREDLADAIDHKLWGLTMLGFPTYLVVPWAVSDFGAEGMAWLGSGLYGVGYNGNAIGNVEGKSVHIYPVPTPNAGLEAIAKGPDGAMWFTEQNADKIGRFDPSTHQFTEYPVTTPNAGPYGITAGPDGALWFTEAAGNQIGRITTSGQITEYPIPTQGSYPVAIATGPDHALWFAEFEGNQIGRITTSGQVTEYPVPTSASEPAGIAAGAGGLWFTEYGRAKVGRITTKGKIKEFKTPTANSGPYVIVRGPDGDMWFGEYNVNKIGGVTPGGHIHEFTAAGNPTGLAASNNTLFYAAYHVDNVVAVRLKK